MFSVAVTLPSDYLTMTPNHRYSEPTGAQPIPPQQRVAGQPQQRPPQQQPVQQQPPGQQYAPQQQLPPQQMGPTAGGQQAPGQPFGVAQQPQQRAPRGPALKPRRVSEILTEEVVTAERNTPVQTIVASMAQHNIGSVVVVEDDRPIGIITDREVALALEERPDIAKRPAEELLQGNVFTADPSMNIFDAVRVMRDEGIRRLPIVDDNGALRGIVTLDDALVLLGGVLGDVADTVQSQSPRL